MFCWGELGFKYDAEAYPFVGCEGTIMHHAGNPPKYERLPSVGVPNVVI